MSKGNLATDNGFNSLDKKMMESVDSFIKLTGIPVSYYDKDAGLIWESHNNKNMCAFCKAYRDEKSFCRMNLKYSGDIAAQLGEPYIFLCKARLTLIAFPVIINNEHLGTFSAGPIILGKLRSNVVEYVLHRSDSNKKQAQVIMQLNETGIYEPKMVSAIANIFGNCIYSSINFNPQYENIQNSFQKSRKISEIIQKEKKNTGDVDTSYPVEIEKELIEAVTSGDVEESIELMHRYLDAVTLINIGNINLIKLYVIQMFGLLLRRIRDDLTVFEDAKDKYDFQLDKINKATNIAELSGIVSDLIEQITALFEAGIYRGDVDTVKDTINYIYKHYMDKISLNMLSEHLHISAPYLSILFKKETGKTFSDFLTQFRIKKSENLLKETALNITEIAMLTGFEDQSYFNKVFKKITGITPKQYRINN